ncbi:MAG TPA: TonB-dependent receptor [Kiritimatiellia bacterium]|nr:TonB-dependent receptor [Kiritimatiellia bacterium]HMO98377.1 TonB-dependent receptor [Kiritimatiellia bacterium]HMP96765.1 TonB-dependent receptor [Kiritimatiellia bacterium]
MKKSMVIVAGAVGAMAVMVHAQDQGRTVVLEDVVVTGTRTEKPLSEAPVRTELIRRVDIENLSALTLADAVEFTSGVRVENNCQNCGFNQMRLLGLDGAYSQILIDGQPLMSSLAAVYGIEQIPTRMIERIEIVKGGGSALYGPGAVAGVVNIISRDPRESGGEVEATYMDVDGAGSVNVSALGGVVSSNGATRFTVFGQMLEQDAYDRDGDGFSDLTERQLEAFGFRLRQSITEEADVVMHYTRTFEDRRGGDRLDLPEFQAEVAESVQATRDVGGLSWSHAPSLKFDYRLTASFALTERDSYYGSGQDPNAFGSSKNPVYVLDSQFNHYLDAHTVSWGAQYQHEKLEDRQPAYNRITDETYDNAGLFVQDDWRFADTINLILGARVDKHSEINDPILSPRMALKWSPDHDVSVRASYAEGFRAPQVFDEDLHITQVGGEGQVIRNDPELEEERSRSYSLGMEWTPELAGGRALFETTLFYTELKNAFALENTDNPATPDFEFTRLNRGGAEVYGAEFNVGYQIPDVFEVVLGYVHQKARYADPDEDFGSRDYFRTPDDYAVLKVTWQNPRLIDVFVGAKYTGPMQVPHYAGFIEEDVLKTTESFLTWDASVSRRIVGLRWTLGVKNITDEYQDDLDQGPERDAGYVYGPRMPRTFYVSAKAEF